MRTYEQKVRLGSIVEESGYIIRSANLGYAWLLIDAKGNPVWNMTTNPYKLTGEEKILILSMAETGTQVDFVKIDMPEERLGSIITSFFVEYDAECTKFTYKMFGKNWRYFKDFFKSFSEINKNLTY